MYLYIHRATLQQYAYSCCLFFGRVPPCNGSHARNHLQDEQHVNMGLQAHDRSISTSETETFKRK